MTQENNQKSSIFRPNALKRLNVFHDTQLLLRIINPGSWLWISATSLFLAGFLLWAICGRISMSISATGIILPENGQVLPIVATHQGNISIIYAKKGKPIKKDTLLAEVSNPYIDEDLKYLRKIYTDDEQLLNQFKEHILQKKALLETHFQQEKKMLHENLKDHEEKLSTLEDLLTKKRALYEKHYLTILEMNQAKEDVMIAKKELAKVKSDLELAPIRFKEENGLLDEKMNAHLAKVLESRHALDKKILEKKNGSKITSPAEGIITAHHVSKGDYIISGKTLFTLVTCHSHEALEALVFVAHSEGKKISVGMNVHVLPNAISVYEYGYIKGKIIELSEYPASKESVHPYLGNMTLVDEFFSGGVPFLAKIKLKKTQATQSGLAWTSRKGPPFKIKPGSTVSVKIIFKESSPLELLTRRAARG